MRYAVSVDGATPPTGKRYDRMITVRGKPAEDANVQFRADEVIAAIGRPLRREEEDWLDLLRAVHVADLACRRGKNEDWNREIVLALPMRDPSRVQAYVTLLQEIFGRMTHDRLEVHIEPDSDPRPGRFPRGETPAVEAVALLSGGLDSARAAVTILDRHTAPCFIASRSSSHVIAAQKAVVAALGAKYGRPVVTTGFKVEPRRTHPEFPLPESDLSQRGRTLLFAGVAATVAAARGIDTVTLGENGIMAINCPLTPGRAAGFSTHTAHPDVLALMGTLFGAVLGTPIRIDNPLLHKTKTEVVAELAAAGLADLIPRTHSCWIARQASHCGVCVPCIVRRFATEAAGVADVRYDNDCFDAPASPQDEKFAAIGDYLFFVANFDTLPDEELLFEYGELNVEGGAAARQPLFDTHRRWMGDVLRVARANRHSPPDYETRIRCVSHRRSCAGSSSTRAGSSRRRAWRWRPTSSHTAIPNACGWRRPGVPTSPTAAIPTSSGRHSRRGQSGAKIVRSAERWREVRSRCWTASSNGMGAMRTPRSTGFRGRATSPGKGTSSPCVAT
jgi:7-cyano-7-deazaguanine synthase in queuosine biosynthesis